MGPTSPPQKPLVGTPLASARSPYLGTPMGLAQCPPPHIGGPLWGSRLPGPEPPIFRDAPPLHGAHPVHPEECLLRPPPGLTLAPLFPVPAASPPPTLPLSIPPLPAASSPGSESPLPGPPGCCTARAPPPPAMGAMGARELHRGVRGDLGTGGVVVGYGDPASPCLSFPIGIARSLSCCSAPPKSSPTGLHGGGEGVPALFWGGTFHHLLGTGSWGGCGAPWG